MTTCGSQAMADPAHVPPQIRYVHESYERDDRNLIVNEVEHPAHRSTFESWDDVRQFQQS